LHHGCWGMDAPEEYYIVISFFGPMTIGEVKVRDY